MESGDATTQNLAERGPEVSRSLLQKVTEDDGPVRPFAALEKVAFFPDHWPRMEMSFLGHEDLSISFFEELAKDRWREDILEFLQSLDPSGSGLGLRGCLSIHQEERGSPAGKRRCFARPTNELLDAPDREEEMPADAGIQLLEAILVRDMSQAQGLLMAKRTALHLAATQGVVGLCRMLINHGAELDGQDALGNSALHLAVLDWQNLMIRVMLEAQASPNLVNATGETPLMLAVNAGNMQAMQLLLDANASVDFTSAGPVAEGGSVLLRAVQRQVLCELVELLLTNRANLEARDQEETEKETAETR
eukprot:g13179.t1